MEVKTLEDTIRAHPFFAGVNDEFCKLVVGCAKNVHFNAGQYIGHEGEPFDHLFLVRQGRVAFEIASPGRKPIIFQTIGEGQIVGVSWLIPPYHWSYDAKAVDFVRAIAIDATCLRDKCEADHDLGYEMMKRFVPVLIERLHGTRMQLLDVYGPRT